MAALAVASVYQLVTPTEARELSELAVVFVLATLVQWAVVADSIEGIHPLRALLRAIITGCAAVAAVALLYPFFSAALPGLKRAITVQVGLAIAIGLLGDTVVRKALSEKLFGQRIKNEGGGDDAG
jgi:hypothetical protein